MGRDAGDRGRLGPARNDSSLFCSDDLRDGPSRRGRVEADSTADVGHRPQAEGRFRPDLPGSRETWKRLVHERRNGVRTHDRVDNGRLDTGGKITLRHSGTPDPTGIGRTHARPCVIVLVQDLHIRVSDAATGELLRELIFDTTKRYQGPGRPPGARR